MKAISVLVAFLIFLFCSFSAKSAFAARSLIISSDKTSLFGYEDMTITASASGFTDGELIYIKGAFYQDGSTNYFGYARNGDNWIKNGDSTTSQKQIKTGDWDNKLVVKSDFSDSGYKGEGGYKFKIGFYYLTSGGNLSSVNWSSNSLDVNLNEPDPTPTPTPISTNTPTIAPTSTSTSSPIPTKSPSTTPKLLMPTSSTLLDNNVNGEVLGNSSESAATNSADRVINKQDSNKKEIVLSSRENNIAKVLIVLGFVFILACGILFFWPYIKKKIKKNE